MRYFRSVIVAVVTADSSCVKAPPLLTGMAGQKRATEVALTLLDVREKTMSATPVSAPGFGVQQIDREVLPLAIAERSDGHWRRRGGE